MRGRVIDLDKLAAAVCRLDLTQLGDALDGVAVGVPEVDEAEGVDLIWLAADIRARVAEMIGGDLGAWLAGRAGDAWEEPAELWLACADGIGARLVTGDVVVLDWSEVM